MIAPLPVLAASRMGDAYGESQYGPSRLLTSYGYLRLALS